MCCTGSAGLPQANPDGILPNATFTGGTPGTVGSFNTDNRWPFFGFNTLWNFSGNVTKIAGNHNIKAGLFVEHTTRPAQRASTYNGSLSFNTDGSNPLNTNVGFANALLGAVTQYQESDGHPEAHGQFMNTEWYLQDNWRLKKLPSTPAAALLLPRPERGDRGRCSTNPSAAPRSAAVHR